MNCTFSALGDAMNLGSVSDTKIIDEVERLVTNNKLEIALERLKEIETLREFALLQLSRLAGIQSKQNRGTLSPQDVDVELTKVSAAILSSISDIRKEIESHLRNFVDISFVILAMTTAEANQLATGSVPGDSESLGRFSHFQEELKKQMEISDWLQQYGGNEREDWKPAFPYNQASVRDIVSNELRRINQQLPSRLFHDKRLLQVNPQFKSTNFCSKSTRVQTWSQLNKSGYIVIADAVSLFHPELSRVLVQSGIQACSLAALFVLLPVSSAALCINEIMEDELRASQETIHNMLCEQTNQLFETSVGGINLLQRWLYDIIPEMQARMLGWVPATENCIAVQQTVKISGIEQEALRR